MKSILLVKKFLGLVEMTSGLVNASFGLPKWQAVKIIFFAPWPSTWPYFKFLATLLSYSKDGTCSEVLSYSVSRSVSDHSPDSGL